MNLFDVVVLATATGAAVGGYRLGFLARVASWVGLAVGLALAVRLLPRAMEALQGPDPSGRLIVAFLLLVAGALGGQAIGLVVGTRLRSIVAPGPLRLVDRAVGAGIGGLGVLVAVWLLLPTMSELPGWPAQQTRNSVVARAIDRSAPAPPDALQALRRLVGESSFPRVFDRVRPAIDTGPPPSALVVPPEVQRQVAASTVKVQGVACGRIQEGSGFVVAPQLVATNAHVVAGEQRSEIMRNDGRRMRAEVVAFDPDRDIALLSVPDLTAAPLPR